MTDSKPTFFSGFCDICLSFLSSFAKLRNTTVSYDMSFPLSLCLSVCRSAGMEHLGYHWTDFQEI